MGQEPTLHQQQPVDVLKGKLLAPFSVHGEFYFNQVLQNYRA